MWDFFPFAGKPIQRWIAVRNYNVFGFHHPMQCCTRWYLLLPGGKIISWICLANPQCICFSPSNRIAQWWVGLLTHLGVGLQSRELLVTHSIALYYISLLSGLGNIDDQNRNPNMNNRDHLVGRPTNCKGGHNQWRCFNWTILHRGWS